MTPNLPKMRSQNASRRHIGSAVVCLGAVFTVLGLAESARAASFTTCQALADLTVGNTKISNLSCAGDIANSPDVLISFADLTNDVEYSLIGNALSGSLAGSIGYNIEIILGQNVFKSVQLTADGTTDSVYSAVKDISWSGGVAQLVTTQTGLEPVFNFPVLNVKKLTILDSWKATQGEVQVVKNNFVQVPGEAPPDSVPGPVPILGAAAAFAFSRKLRARIQKPVPMS
ncbi:hypothetical protein [Aphanothece minutissima]|uniref:hypothetical protein n=1 Tax=Aphanothece minutissima TaxID=543815 RepID=UPI0011B2155F|nr:hypothetical protein [Aphanothece minutissima]